MKKENKPASFVEPTRVEVQDVARPEEVGTSVWAQFFPFLLVMMSLTGAFYPAIDLCAGEKERGTMETLLISPASRTEIVLGKFLTVLAASMATATLNLLSMGLTGWQLARSIGTVGRAGNRLESVLAAPNLSSAVWMVVLLIPLSAMFSALCLALAAMARSMKEGQYYLTPLYIVALPLMMVTMMPGIELDLFTSLIPISGVSLLLRALMQGKYEVAARFSLPVLLPTILYGVLALKWAVDQFNTEGVLFREAERFTLKDWLRHLVRDREPRPTPGMALLCFALMISTAWFTAASLGSSPRGVALSLVAIVLTPPVILAFLFTSDPLGTLRLRRPRLADLALAVALAVAWHPVGSILAPLVQSAFPMSKQTQETLQALFSQVPDLGTAILVFAAVPAVCEEVAFRGFFLSGLERGGRISAVVTTAFLFGFLHVLLSVFQQFFNAALLGLVLGLIAFRSRSLWPCIAFHFVNNLLAVTDGAVAGEAGRTRLAAILFDPGAAGQAVYRWPWVALGSAAFVGGLAVLWRRRDAKGAGEALG